MATIVPTACRVEQLFAEGGTLIVYVRVQFADEVTLTGTPAYLLVEAFGATHKAINAKPHITSPPGLLVDFVLIRFNMAFGDPGELSLTIPDDDPAIEGPGGDLVEGGSYGVATIEPSSSLVFTSPGTFSWRSPVNGTIRVDAWGGGGGGGQTNGFEGGNAAGGGGGGGFAEATLGVSVGDLCTIIVGAGGAAGTNASPDGLAGGASSFLSPIGGTVVFANGGGPGINGEEVDPMNPALGGTATTGTTLRSGGNGGAPGGGGGAGGLATAGLVGQQTVGTVGGLGGPGGGPNAGRGGRGGSFNTLAALPGLNAGGGGGGAFCDTDPGCPGGAGANGRVQITLP